MAKMRGDQHGVAGAEFMGPFLRTYLTLEGSEASLIADFSVNAVRDLSIGEGSDLTVALPADRLLVFAGDRT